MTVRLLYSDGDIATSGTQFTSGVEEVAQTVKTNLKLFLGEYFRNILDGTPWFQQILGKGASFSARESIIKRRIIQTEGVTSISTFSTDFDLTTRAYSVDAGIITAFGTTTISINGIV